MTKRSLTINGSAVEVEVDEDETLLSTLRDRLGLRSVRYCCGIGVCGTCSVLLDGRPVSSCLLLSTMVGARAVQTAEGLDPDGPVGKAFVECSAFQCSYCIPGMMVTATGVLANEPQLEAAELREALGGNLCRCGSYPQVMDALLRACSGTSSLASES
ncbi:MAG: (2Fe-2S)-binding protein [Acidimicrobiales bacterium]